MFTELDRILFPERCEVIQIAPQRFVFPIFKNGSSSLQQAAKNNGWRTLLNSQITKCDRIDVFIRHPELRFVSGFNTYIENLITENPYLDVGTAVWFGLNHLFMDRHYLPQFLWLSNLSRYLNRDCLLEFRGMDNIKDVTDLRLNESKHRYEFAIDILNAPNINAYIRLDSYLYDCIDRSMTYNDLLLGFEKVEPHLYKHIFQIDRKIIDALP